MLATCSRALRLRKDFRFVCLWLVLRLLLENPCGLSCQREAQELLEKALARKHECRQRTGSCWPTRSSRRVRGLWAEAGRRRLRSVPVATTSPHHCHRYTQYGDSIARRNRSPTPPILRWPGAWLRASWHHFHRRNLYGTRGSACKRKRTGNRYKRALLRFSAAAKIARTPALSDEAISINRQTALRFQRGT